MKRKMNGRVREKLFGQQNDRLHAIPLLYMDDAVRERNERSQFAQFGFTVHCPKSEQGVKIYR